MKYKALSLLLTVSILAMSMATLFTACPEPKPEALPEPTKSGGGGGNPEVDKSATAPGQARNLSADTSKALEITFRAIAPASNGTKKGGAAVTKAELKYQLYYAKIGITSNSVIVSGDTTAADVVKAVGSTTGTDDKAKGRIEASAANLATGFTLSSLTAETKYRYTVVVVHPNGTNNSEPAEAQTSGAVRAKPSQATAPPVPTLNTPNPKTNTVFTVTWNDPDLTTAKKDTGEQLLAGDVGYVVYYTSATDEPTAEAVKAAGSSETSISGKVPVGATKTATASGKAFVHTVYMVLEAINNTDTSKTKLSEVTEYAVTGAATPPTAPTVNVTPGEAQLTVQVTALTAGFGTTDKGTPLDADTVTYIFYYAKKGEDIGGTNVEDAGVTSDHMYDALKGLTTNTANKGKVALTTAEGIGTPKVVPKLTPATDYHYTVRAQEKDTPANGVNTPKAKATTPKPKFWHVSTLATGFNNPYGIAVATDGTLYIADTGNHQIKKLTIDGDGKGTVSLIAGDGTKGFENKGAYKDAEAGKDAQFDYPIGIVIDPKGTVLYIADSGNHRIRKIVLSGTYKVTTIAGSIRGYAEGTGAAAKFNYPYGIVIDPKGTVLYIADSGNHRIRKIVLSGTYKVTTIAGSIRGYAEGTGAAAKFNYPYGIAIDPKGTALYIADNENNRIRKIVLSGTYKVTTIATGFNYPYGIALTTDGTLYVADTNNYIIKKLTLNANGSLKAITIIAGSTKGNTNGIGTSAQFNNPSGIAVVSDTILYVADKENNSIKKLEYKE